MILYSALKLFTHRVYFGFIRTVEDSETKVYLIRHGAVENPGDVAYGRLPGFPLSRKGRAQVVQLVAVLKSKGVRKFDAIYSSPLERAAQTAQILKELFGSTNIKTSELLTDTAVPVLEGKPLDIVRAVEFDNFRPGFKVAGSETPQDIIRRMTKFLKKVRQNHQGETVAVVTHGDPSRLLLWSLQHPGGGLPDKLRDGDYLGPAETIVLRFDKAGGFLGYEHIRQGRESLLEKDQANKFKEAS